jgi:FKBP-type peptidyl-prolyl cis-trans isomerase SlyD
MQISKDKIVTFNYRLQDEKGVEIESSNDADTMAYLHGHGNIITGLEKGMDGRNAEDIFSITVEAKDAYGERDEDAKQRIPLKHLNGDKRSKANLKPGMVVSINTEEGAKQVIVIKAGKFNVDVDVNHPLAGKTLTFDVDIQEVRDATAEEVSHGHAHGVGGHHH